MGEALCACGRGAKEAFLSNCAPDVVAFVVALAFGSTRFAPCAAAEGFAASAFAGAGEVFAFAGEGREVGRGFRGLLEEIRERMRIWLMEVVWMEMGMLLKRRLMKWDGNGMGTGLEQNRNRLATRDEEKD